MEPSDVAKVLADPVAVRLLESANPARLADIALDATPRVVPVGSFWNGASMTVVTVPGSAKFRGSRGQSLRRRHY